MTRKKLGVGDIRDMEREAARPLNQNGVWLPNPTAEPSFDRHEPIPSDQKARAFGMEPTSPKRLFDLPQGDAGAGQSVYRRIHAFYPMGLATPTGALSLNYTKALEIATNRSTTKSPRYFHVSIYGFGVRRQGGFGELLAPLTIAQAQDRQFEAIYFNTPAQPDLTPRFIPSVASAQARVMIHDESGQRFFDVDVIGTRSFTVYAFGVTVFLLVKPPGYEVDEQNPDSLIPIDANGLGVEDDIVGARIVPIFTNRTESIQNRTISITIDAVGRTIVPIPPGARRVQIFSNEPGPALLPVILQFWFGRGSFGSRPDLGIIDWEPGQSKTAMVEIPNASAISINVLGIPPVPTGFILIFEVES